MPSPRRYKNTTDYKDAPSSDDESRKPNQPRGYRPGIPREDSIIKREAEAGDRYDSGWDTDYDPKDKYYLSDEEDPFDSYFTPKERKTPVKNGHGRERRSPSKRSDSHYGHSSRRSHADSESRSHGHRRHRSPPPPRRRDDKDDDGPRHGSKPSSQAKPNSSSYDSHPRPKPSRAASSYHRPSRPRTTRASSSYAGSRPGRPGPRRGVSNKSTYTMPKAVRDMVKRLDPSSVAEVSDFWENFPWQEAAKVAVKAGTVAALKVGSDPIPWPVKGTKIASAALGAAVVDHVLKPKKKGGVKYAAMRHLAEVAVGSLVVGPALGKASTAGGRGRGGGRRK